MYSIRKRLHVLITLKDKFVFYYDRRYLLKFSFHT